MSHHHHHHKQYDHDDYVPNDRHQHLYSNHYYERAPPQYEGYSYGRSGYGVSGEGAPLQYFHQEETKHKRQERLGELAALGAGAYALYEAHRANVDPVNASRHKLEAGLAAAAAAGAGGFALYEHKQEKNYGAAEEQYGSYHGSGHHKQSWF